MGRPKIEEFKVRNIGEIWLNDQTASARKIWMDSKFRFGQGNTPSERKTQEIVRGLRDRGDAGVVDPDPLIKPWSERWRNREELETLFVLHYTALSTDPFLDVFNKPVPDFKGLTDREGTWACRLRNLFDLSSRRETLMLLWFSLQYSGLERTALSLGYEPEYIFSDHLDRDLMEWTGRVPQKYPGDYVPDEIGLEEWVYHWFKDISEGRKPMWGLDHDDIEFREAIEKRNQTKDWRTVK